MRGAVAFTLACTLIPSRSPRASTALAVTSATIGRTRSKHHPHTVSEWRLWHHLHNGTSEDVLRTTGWRRQVQRDLPRIDNRFEAIARARALGKDGRFSAKNIGLDGYILAPAKTTPDSIPGAKGMSWADLEDRFPLLRQDGAYIAKVVGSG